MTKPPIESTLSPHTSIESWDDAFVVAAEAGMEIGDALSEAGAIDMTVMRRLTEIHEKIDSLRDDIETDEESDAEVELLVAAGRLIKAALPSTWAMIVSNDPETHGHHDDAAVLTARGSGFITGFVSAVAATVLVGPASSRWEPPVVAAPSSSKVN